MLLYLLNDIVYVTFVFGYKTDLNYVVMTEQLLWCKTLCFGGLYLGGLKYTWHWWRDSLQNWLQKDINITFKYWHKYILYRTHIYTQVLCYLLSDISVGKLDVSGIICQGHWKKDLSAPMRSG